MDHEYPEIKFKVISNSKKLNEFSLAASKREEQFFQLDYNTYWIQYVPYPLKINEEFSLFGEKANEVYENYIKTIPEDERVLKTIYYGVPINQTDGFKITNEIAPSGSVGKLYYFKFSTLNGIEPIKWSIPSGELPEGLILDESTGQIYGAPEIAGGYAFYLQAEDSRYPKNKYTKTFFISIYPNQIETITYEFQSTNTEVAMPGGIIGSSLTGIRIAYTTNYTLGTRSYTKVYFNNQLSLNLYHSNLYDGQVGIVFYNGVNYTITFGSTTYFTISTTTTPLPSTTTTTTIIPTSTTTSTTPIVLTTTTTTTTPFPYCAVMNNLPMPGISYTYSGTTLSGSGTGSILNYNSYYSCCDSLIKSSSSPIWLGAIVSGSTVFNYTVSFSKIVNNIIIVIAGSNAGESFTFNSNTGTVNLINVRSCGYSVTGNTATAVLEYAGGAGIYLIINNNLGFNSLNITGPGAGGGSVLSICMNGN